VADGLPSSIVLHVSPAASSLLQSGTLQEFVLVSQISHQEHSPKQLQSSKQIFQFTLNFQFIFKSLQSTSILFNTPDKSVQCEVSNLFQLFKFIFTAEDKHTITIIKDVKINVFFII
jgi:hypothetical protein